MPKREACEEDYAGKED